MLVKDGLGKTRSVEAFPSEEAAGLVVGRTKHREHGSPLGAPPEIVAAKVTLKFPTKEQNPPPTMQPELVYPGEYIAICRRSRKRSDFPS